MSAILSTLCIVLLSQSCISKIVKTVETTTTTDVSPDETPHAKLPKEINLLISSAPDTHTIEVKAIKSSDNDSQTYTEINLVLRPLLPYEYWNKKCQILNNTIAYICSRELDAIDTNLDQIDEFIKEIPENISSDANAVESQLTQFKDKLCPTSESWMTYISCFCTKCQHQMMEIPNHEKWEKLWKMVSFCEHTFPENTDLCQWMKQYQNPQITERSRNMNVEDKVEVDEMFRKSWNEEIKSEIHVDNDKQDELFEDAEDKEKKNEDEEEKEENEDEKVDDEIDDILDELDDESVSNLIMAHPLIYIWTIACASFVTILSFFIFYR